MTHHCIILFIAEGGMMILKWKLNVQRVQEVRQVLHFPSVLHLPERKGKNGFISNISPHLCKTILSKGEFTAIRVISSIWLAASAWGSTHYFFWSYSQEFQAVLSLQGNLSVLVVRLCQGLRGVQGLPWCPPFLMDQKVPALQVDLGVRGGRVRPWGRSLLMDPRRRNMERKEKGTCCVVMKCNMIYCISRENSASWFLKRTWGPTTPGGPGGPILPWKPCRNKVQLEKEKSTEYWTL